MINWNRGHDLPQGRGHILVWIEVTKDYRRGLVDFIADEDPQKTKTAFDRMGVVYWTNVNPPPGCEPA